MRLYTTQLIDGSDKSHQLGIAEMDETHVELIKLTNLLSNPNGVAFKQYFDQLFDHTQVHFYS